MALFLDISGFEALFHMHYAALCSTAWRIVLDKDIAEDIVQNVFYRLWKERDTLTINTSLKDHLSESTIRQSVNYIKRYKNTLRREEPSGAGTGHTVNSSERLMEIEEVGALVETVVKSLPDSCRIVFVLIRYEHLRYKKIAEHLDIPVRKVENYMMEAMKHFNRYLL